MVGTELWLIGVLELTGWIGVAALGAVVAAGVFTRITG